ncbi:MAG: phage holin family protein [Fimbriimonadaceae bacterium]|nr:phage holin family protein [Chitinophagales bacterium]
MEETKKDIEKFYDDLRDYLNTRIELASLITAEKAAGALSTIITKGTFIFVLLFGLIFGSIALALYIGQARDNMIEGFLFVAAGYFIIGIFLIVVNHQWLKKPILNSFIKQFFNDDK